MTIHFIYVKGEGVGTPFAITNEVTKRLSKKHALMVYDWSEKTTIYPSPGDILLGHPHPLKNTVYRRSFMLPGWQKRIVLCPFAHAHPEYIAFLDQIVPYADHYLAICGPYWTRTISESLFAHWQPKISRLDLGVNQEHFPTIKQHFAPPGKRRFVTVGRLGHNKGSDYLSALADAAPDLSFSWIGGDAYPSTRVKALGSHDFRQRRSLELFAEHDFVIQCGRSDANPTTILEGASLGLLPVCTPQSGYEGYPWITSIPLDSIDTTLSILRALNQESESSLVALRNQALTAIQSEFTWEKFTNSIEDAIIAPAREAQNEPNKTSQELYSLAHRFEFELKKSARKERWQRLISSVQRRIPGWR